MDKGKSTDISPRSNSLGEVEVTRKLHRISQLSLDALADPKYWDLELQIRDCDQEADRLLLENQKVTFSGAYMDEEKQNFASRTLQREEDNMIILDQRRRVSSKIEEYKSTADNELRPTNDTHATVAKKVAFDQFRPGSRSETSQTVFRQILIQEHNSTDPKDHVSLWCPILHQYMNPTVCKAVHIFPYHMGENVMSQVFGEDSANEMFSARNGLMMCALIETPFDKHQIVIVPKGLPKDRRWKVRIVDKSLLTQKLGEGTWADLENRELFFKGNCRPAARYLYWHYCLAVIHAARDSSNQEWLDDMGEDCWVTPGEYIRANMLRALAEQIGHCVVEDLLNLSEHTIEDSAVQTVDDQAAAVLLAEDSFGKAENCNDDEHYDSDGYSDDDGYEYDDAYYEYDARYDEFDANYDGYDIDDE